MALHAEEFWAVYRQWESRIEVARRNNRPGDIMVLADETPTRVLRMEAKRMAGKALTKLGQFKLALEQFEAALAIAPTDLESNQYKGVLLGRLKRHAQAREHIKSIRKEYPQDPESWALLGRVEKEHWIARWHLPGTTPDAMRTLAADAEALLAEAIEPYQKAFVQDPSHVY